MIQSLSGVIVDGSAPVTKAPTQQNLTFAQGQDVTFQVTITGSNGTAINVTSYSATMVIKPPLGASPTTSLTLAGTITNGPGGVISFTMTSAQSKTLVQYFSYFYDVFTTNGTGGRDEVVLQSFIQLNAAPGM